MTAPSTTSFTVVPAGAAGLPREVLAIMEEAGRCVVVKATIEQRLLAWIVAAPDQRTLEVLHLSEPAHGYPPGHILAAERFRFLSRNQVFHDRSRSAPGESYNDDERVHFIETVLYREPDQVVHTIERGPGDLYEDVHSGVDISAQYASSPDAGDWAFFVNF